jgi:hypothetical protein
MVFLLNYHYNTIPQIRQEKSDTTACKLKQSPPSRAFAKTPLWEAHGFDYPQW